MSTLWFNIRLPSDAGFIGRECAHRECRRYFKILTTDAPKTISCPYCGTAGATNQTHTREQRAYAQNVAKEKALKYAHDEISRIFRDAFGGLPTSGPVRFELKPGRPYQEKTVRPRYREKSVDTDLRCPNCDYSFKVYGIFGYCPRCRTENAQIYDTNLAIIRKELAAESDTKRGLRHAYVDLVSTVEKFCKDKAPPQLREKRRSYQRIDDIEELALACTGKPLDQILDGAQIAALRSAFQKRHVNIHNLGMVDAKYAREVPGSEKLVGLRVELSNEEFDQACSAVQRLISALFIPPQHGKIS